MGQDNLAYKPSDDLPDNQPQDFDSQLERCGSGQLLPTELAIFQMNLGRLCNMRCRHCHVDAGPEHTRLVMSRATIDLCLQALDSTDATTVDLTGGAPEMNPNFSYLVDELVKRGKHIINRCNLSILLEDGYTHLPKWLAERNVEVVCSLPHYRDRNTDLQRGGGAFKRSIEALLALNAVGYGQNDPLRKLVLVTNPSGAFLSGNQATLEQQWKRVLEKDWSVTFDSLITINNLPVGRFLKWLQTKDLLQMYMDKLIAGFNPQTVAGLMCRNTISINWEGYIYDCDFNQMLKMSVLDGAGEPTHITNFEKKAFGLRRIRTASHCYGCTAGAGSSCGGALVE